MTQETPAAVRALAERRVQARAEKDFAASDALREEIAELGWAVRDTADGQVLDVAPPYRVEPNVKALLGSRGGPAEPVRRCGVGILVEGWGGDLRTCVEAVLAHAPADVVVVALCLGDADGAAGVLHDLVLAHPGRVQEHHVEQVCGWAEGRAALLALDPSEVHVLLDPSSVLTGDVLAPVLAAFDDAGVVAAGWRGVDVDDDWLGFHDAGPGEVDALLVYLFAVRRDAALATPPHPKARFYRNADMEWSFLLREAGGRLVVPEGTLPVRQDRHRGYHDSDPVFRDKESRKTYDRFLQRFRGREDLRLPTP